MLILAGVRHRDDRAITAPDTLSRTADFDSDFGNEVHGVIGAAVNLGLPRLPTKALHLIDDHSFDPGTNKRTFHVLELEWLDDGGDELWVVSPDHIPPFTPSNAAAFECSSRAQTLPDREHSAGSTFLENR